MATSTFPSSLLSRCRALMLVAGATAAVVAAAPARPFVRDPAGRVGWVSSGLRLVPRLEADA